MPCDSASFSLSFLGVQFIPRERQPMDYFKMKNALHAIAEELSAKTLEIYRAITAPSRIEIACYKKVL